MIHSSVVVVVLAMSASARAQAVEAPEVIAAPAGWLLPAGVLYGKMSVDHAGGVGADARVGLGGVAEVCVAAADPLAVRAEEPGRIERVVRRDPPRELPFVTVSFRMGLPEDRLFRGQPAIALGFRKSFDHRTGPVTTRFAELHLVASKHLGARAAVHLGASLWDASVAEDGREPFLLHDGDLADQVRAFGGVELRPRDDTAILVDVSWVPVRFGAERVALRPVVAWGLRYTASDRLQLQSGVRVTDIDGRDARLFAQATVTTWSLTRWVNRLDPP